MHKKAGIKLVDILFAIYLTVLALIVTTVFVLFLILLIGLNK